MMIGDENFVGSMKQGRVPDEHRWQRGQESAALDFQHKAELEPILSPVDLGFEFESHPVRPDHGELIRREEGL